MNNDNNDLILIPNDTDTITTNCRTWWPYHVWAVCKHNSTAASHAIPYSL